MTKINPFKWKELMASPLPRAGCAVAVVGGKLITAGGTYWQEGLKFWTDRVDSFDPVSNRWTTVASLPYSRGDAAAAVVGEVLYILGGGVDAPAESTVFAFSNGSWGLAKAMTLPEPRRSSVAVVLDGTIYLLGGLSGTGSEFAKITSTVWAAKPGAAWKNLAPIPGLPRFNAAIGVVNGRIIVVGGCTPEGSGVRNLDEIIVYDPAANTWSVLGHLPLPIRGAWGVADGSRLLAFGGYTDKFINQIHAIDGLSGEVSVAGELPVGLADARFVRLNSALFGVTGENGIKQRFPGTLQSGDFV